MDGHDHLHRHDESEPSRDARPPKSVHPEHSQQRVAEKHAHGEAHSRAHDNHAGHSIAMFRRKFWVSLVLTIPTLVWGHMLQSALHYTAPKFPGSAIIPPALGAAVFAYGGWPFIQGAVREIRDRLPGMMTLITLAISVAFAFSAAVTLGYPGMPLWEELSTLVTVMLLGHWIEMRSINQAQGAIRALAKLLPDTAVRLGDNLTEEIPIPDVRVGDLLLIRPGANVPADGSVRQGESDVNESMITGESRPVHKAAESTVIAGTVNGSGSLRIEVTGTGEHTALAGIMRLVEQAQSSRSRAQDLADRAAFILTLVALGAGMSTLVVWLLLHAEPAFAIERLVTVLVIACPHALGLAIPLVIAISTTLAAQNGFLVRDRRGLEQARTLNAVVFDKTGTLTRGEFGVVNIATADNLTPEEALRLAAAIEHDSEHTIAKGIVKSAEERKLNIPSAQYFEAIPGKGVKARLRGRELYMGGPALLQASQIVVPEPLRRAAQEASYRGQSAIYLAEDSHPLAVFAIADVVRPESKEAVQLLHQRSVEVLMMTGDRSPWPKRSQPNLGSILSFQKSCQSKRLPQ